MDHIDDGIQNQIAALMRVLNVTTRLREDRVPCEIEQGLFLGSLGAATDKEELKSKNITHILTVANSLAPAHPNDFAYKVVSVADKEDTNLSQFFDECINFIDDARRHGGRVLVHCFVGRSRSVTIVVAYLMKKHGMSLSQALEHVKRRRPQAAPNSGFISQLQEFEKSLQGWFQGVNRTVRFERNYDVYQIEEEEGLFLGSLSACIVQQMQSEDQILPIS